MGVLPQLVLNSLVAGAIYSLMALGFNLIYWATKFFNLAHGAMAVIGGYTVFYLMGTLGWNLWFSLTLGVVLAGLVGWLINKTVYLPLRQKKASNLVLLVASLGLFITLQSLLAIFFTSQFQTLSQDRDTLKVYEIFGGTITQTQLFILFSVLIILISLAGMLKYTLFGKAIKAISDDEEVAKIMGIDTNKMIGYIFFLGSAIAGLGGILVGLDTGIEPNMGMGLLLKGVIGSIVGGVGNLYGGVLGSFLLGLAENLGIWKISGEWKEAIAFGVLILFLIFRPQGIMKR